MTQLLRFLKDDSGATAIEYGLIAAGISVAIIAVVQGLGTQLNTTFSSVRARSNGLHPGWSTVIGRESPGLRRGFSFCAIGRKPKCRDVRDLVAIGWKRT